MSIATSGRPTARMSSPSADGLQADFGKFASMLGLRNELREGQQPLLARLSVQLPAVLSLGSAPDAARQRRGDADLHADQRHPADRGLQQLQVQPRRRDRQADRAGDLDDQLLLRPGAARRWRNRMARTASSASSTPTSTYTPTPALSLGARRELRHQRSQQEQTPALSLQGTGVYARYQVTTAAALSAALRAARRRGALRRHRSGAARGHADGGIQVRRRLPAARRVPPRLVQRAVLHRPRRRRPARSTRTRRSSALVWWFGNKTGAW